METGEEINTMKRMLGQFRKTVMEEATRKIKASERSTEEYFRSLGCALTKRFDGIDSRLGEVDSRLGEVDSRLGEVDSRLGEVDSRLGEVDSRLGEVDSRLGEVDSRLGEVEADTKEIKETINRMETKLDGLDRYVRMNFGEKTP